MDASTKTVEVVKKKHFAMLSGERGVWEKFYESPTLKEVEKFESKVEIVKGSKRTKQSTKTQTAQPKDKAIQVFVWRLIPIQVDRKSDRQAVEQFVQKFKKFEKIGEEFSVPDALSPIRDGENFDMPVSTEEWNRNQREAEKKERERYKEEIARNGKEWTAWKIGEFYWGDEERENEIIKDDERQQRNQKSKENQNQKEKEEDKENERQLEREHEQRKRKREDERTEIKKEADKIERKQEENNKRKRINNEIKGNESSIKMKIEANNRKNENIELKKEGTNIEKEEVNVEEKQLKKEDSKNKKENQGRNKGRKIREEDLRTLDGRKWLNDEIINGRILGSPTLDKKI
ncbi:vicilin-like seed storage protein At2g18540 [Venturia canescens]|uniref:vicilin-like seed storage protein At2g18540 n=1 Tax=Venturia canescens TaxID=32260 RepID=UPI001C9C0F17|nr:vicilin-like seed storage protein At2g18540 [Venturia canescens]